MISSLYSEGALTRSVMVDHAERIARQTTPRSRSSDPITSHEAAANASAFAGSQSARIVKALEKLGSGTAQEIGAECGLTVVQVDRRLCELQRAGKARVLEGLDGKPLTRNGFRIWAGV